MKTNHLLSSAQFSTYRSDAFSVSRLIKKSYKPHFTISSTNKLNLIKKIFILVATLFSINGLAQINFATNVDYNTGDNPHKLAIADFNNDGFPDIVSGNFAGNSVSVITNSGNGSFGSKTDFATRTGGTSRCVNIGDFNRDGNMDIISGGLNGISILTNTGSGSFEAAIDYTVTGFVNDIVIGDFNKDNKPDFAVVNFNTSILKQIMIFLNDGTGSFGASTNYSYGTIGGTNNLNKIAIGDFNNDGNSDLAATYSGGNKIAVLTGTGSGTFGGEIDYDAGMTPSGISVADFNGDSQLDLAIANAASNSNTISVLTGTGTGSFGTPLNYSTQSYNQALSVGDFNSDGKMDIAVANTGSSTVSILIGTGTGNFSNPINFPKGTSAFDISVSDLNGDNLPDIAVSNSAAGKISILINKTGIPYISSINSNVSGVQYITITGFSLGSTTGVLFPGGVVATPTSVSQTQVTVNVPCGAISGLITLTGTSTTAISPTELTIIPIPLTQIINTSTNTNAGISTFSVTAIGANLTYLWSTGETTPSITTSILGMYIVTVSSTCGSDITSTFVFKLNQNITLTGLAVKTYGDAPFTISASTNSGLSPFNFSVTGPAAIIGNSITITGAGVVTVTAFQAGDANYFPATASQTFTINKASQTITMPAFGYVTYGTSVPANATTTSGLIVSLSVTGPNAVIVGSNISFTGVGNVTITAYQLGNTNYLPAANVKQSFTVYQGFQNFTIVGLPSTVTYTTPPFSYDVLFTSGLPSLITFAGPAAIANNMATVTGLGVVTVTAFQGGNTLYRPTTIVRYFQVYKASQTITFPSLGNKVTSDPPFSISATASSGLTVSFSVTGPAAIAGNTITLSGATGTVSVYASQAGNAYYNSAPNVLRIFSVNPGRLGVKEETETSGVSLYPNPASGFVYLSSDSPLSEIEIYNPAGICVLKTGPVDKIDVSSFYSGLYTFRITSSSGVHTQKMVIDK